MVTLLAKIVANFNAFQIEMVFPSCRPFQSELLTAIVTVRRHLKRISIYIPWPSYHEYFVGFLICPGSWEGDVGDEGCGGTKKNKKPTYQRCLFSWLQ